MQQIWGDVGQTVFRILWWEKTNNWGKMNVSLHSPTLNKKQTKPRKWRKKEKYFWIKKKTIMYIVHVCDWQRVETMLDKGLLQGKSNTKPWEPVVSPHCGYRGKEADGSCGGARPASIWKKSWRHPWHPCLFRHPTQVSPKVLPRCDARLLSGSTKIPGMWDPQSVFFTGIDELTCGPGLCQCCLGLYHVMARVLHSWGLGLWPMWFSSFSRTWLRICRSMENRTERLLEQKKDEDT